MAFCDSKYFKKIGVLQENIHKSEKIRLDLERDLFAYCRSDSQSLHINKTRLLCYLKNVCERETRAQRRNLELLGEAERARSQAAARNTGSGTLHQTKVECWNNIRQLMATGKNKDKQEIVSKGSDAMLASLLPSKSSVIFDIEPHHSASMLMGQQASGLSSAKPLASCSPLLQPSGPLPESSSSVPAENGTSVNRFSLHVDNSGPCLPAIMLAGRDSAMGGDASGTRGASAFALTTSWPYQAAQPSAVCGNSQAPRERLVVCGGPAEHTTNSSPEEYEGVQLQPKVSSAVRTRRKRELSVASWLSLQNRSQSDASLSGGEDRSSSDVSPLRAQELAHASGEGPPLLGEDEHPDGAPDTSVRRRSTLESAVEPGCTPRPARSVDIHGHGLESQSLDGTGFSGEQVRTSRASETTAGGISLEGLCHLLSSIEERLHQRTHELYKISSISEGKLGYLISLCNGKSTLSEEDLEVCGAVVLCELQRLSWSTSKGCLLTKETISSHRTTASWKKIRPALHPDGAALWERWLEHALLLQRSGIFTTDEIADVFTPSLVQKGACYIKEARALLSRLLQGECGGSPTSGSDRSSRDPPSLLHDSEAIKSHAPGLHRNPTGIQEQELQSVEEDSEEERFAQSIPIRETKPYQLLKQCVAQQRRRSSEDDSDGGSDADLSGDGNVTSPGKNDVPKVSAPRSQEVPLFGAERTISAVKSKAFWGESDDSSNDIEAALRPQSHHTDSEDFDFYD